MSTNETRKIYILFTGQLRNTDLFNQSLAELFELKAEGIIEEIIFSTWRDEYLQKNCDMNKDLVVIESDFIKNTGHGNYIAQMKHYIEGLMFIHKFSQKCFVLKTRTDIYINKKFLKKLIDFDFNIGENFTKIFQHKIWVPWFEITKPFYLEDSYFFGEINDMFKLYNLSKIYTWENLEQGITHIRRFSFPFLNYFPIVEEFVNNKYGLSTNILENYKLDLLPQEQEEYIINLLATYYFIMKTYFVVDSDNNAIFFSDKQNGTASGGRPLIKNNKKLDPNLSLSENNTKNFALLNIKVDYDFDWLNNLIKGKFNYDPISQSIALELNKMLQQKTSFYFYKKANSCVKKGKLDEAINMYKSAIKHNNSFAWYYYYLGTVLEKTSRTDEAVEAYKIAISMNPNSSSFHDSLKKLIDQ